MFLEILLSDGPLGRIIVNKVQHTQNVAPFGLYEVDACILFLFLKGSDDIDDFIDFAVLLLCGFP